MYYFLIICGILASIVSIVIGTNNTTPEPNTKKISLFGLYMVGLGFIVMCVIFWCGLLKGCGLCDDTACCEDGGKTIKIVKSRYRITRPTESSSLISLISPSNINSN